VGKKGEKGEKERRSEPDKRGKEPNKGRMRAEQAKKGGEGATSRQGAVTTPVGQVRQRQNRADGLKLSGVQKPTPG